MRFRIKIWIASIQFLCLVSEVKCDWLGCGWGAYPADTLSFLKFLVQQNFISPSIPFTKAGLPIQEEFKKMSIWSPAAPADKSLASPAAPADSGGKD
jgi:hypothetical protein